MEIKKVRELVKLVEDSGIAELEIIHGDTTIRIEAERAKWKEIRSPIVGTFYRAAAPGADVFVNVGDRIQNGQTLCIIEAMKVMNEIEAEFGGIVKEILVENGQPIEAEAILYLVEPS